MRTDKEVSNLEKILFVNACEREKSRTMVIAKNALEKYDGEIKEIFLNDEKLTPLTRELLEKRDKLIAEKQLDHDMFCYARELAEADRIVIAAPFWDLGFPALLKIYLESVMVSGITFEYDKGIPKGMCKAKSLEYITTSGGPIFEDYGYSYVKSLAKNFFGISDVSCIMAQNMDVMGVTCESILDVAEIIEKH